MQFLGMALMEERWWRAKRFMGQLLNVIVGQMSNIPLRKNMSISALPLLGYNFRSNGVVYLQFGFFITALYFLVSVVVSVRVAR